MCILTHLKFFYLGKIDDLLVRKEEVQKKIDACRPFKPRDYEEMSLIKEELERYYMLIGETEKDWYLLWLSILDGANVTTLDENKAPSTKKFYTCNLINQQQFTLVCD